MKVVYRDAAAREYLDALDWYEERQPGLGQAFRRAVRQAERRLTEFPESAPYVDRDFRGCLIRRFPYQLVYRIEDDVIRVYALFHCAQDPDQLRSQLEGQ